MSNLKPDNDAAELDRLQERLEQLERGGSLEACQAGLPEHEVGLLVLADRLGQVDYPEPEQAVAAVQRARLINLARKETNLNTQTSQTDKSSGRWPRWVIPTAVLGGALAFLFICALIAALGAGGLWLYRRKAAVTPALAYKPTAEALSTRAETIKTPTVKATSPHVETRTTPTAAPLVLGARDASLQGERGVVEVQGKDGQWLTIQAAGRVVRARMRVRTGALSAVDLHFSDGSVAHLGPDSELSVDELDARTDGPRVVVLTQWRGETRHDVSPSAVDGSRYEVNTPTGKGVAKGTMFYVLVTPLLARFSVDEGVVAVTHLDVTVVIVAGQLTTVLPQEPPAAPLLHITGEGQVSQTDPSWIIAGQAFQTHAGAITVGNPQAGDWVWVDGHLLPDGTRIADRIVLLRRSPDNQFSIQGEVEKIGAETWAIAGQTISVTAQTAVVGKIAVGDVALAQGHILENGTLVAERIALVQEQPGLPFEFVGVAQAVDDTSWMVSGISVTVNAATEIDDGLVVGDKVKVRGFIAQDGAWLAAEIRRAEQEPTFEFTGHVESLAPWIISGITFETRDWTEIDEGIQIGDLVKVEGTVMEDGARVATEVKLLDEQDEGTYIEFVGRVISIDPWNVSGIPLIVDDETILKGNIRPGVRVRVKAMALPEGTLAYEIKAIGFAYGQGCLNISSIVVSIDDTQVRLLNGLVIPLSAVQVEGEIVQGSVVTLLACVDDLGQVTFLDIIVVYAAAPGVVPLPTAVIQPTSAPDENEMVVICHKPDSKNPQTMTVTRSALNGHLGHGDHLGSCQRQDGDDDDDDDDDDDKGKDHD